MRRLLLIFVILTVAARPISDATPGQRTPGDPTLIGFSSGAAAAQIALEARFDGMLDATRLDAWTKQMTDAPQHVGSPKGKENAEFVAGLFREWGYETEIVRYDVLFPTPIERSLELVGPVKYRARLDEPVLPEDASSAVRKGMLPPYNAYSADGDVEGELVYVNYGVPDDYEELARRGIDVRGKIVIARYGGSWRGIKPKVAFEHGAIGCLIYSDPRDDGYFEGDVYPEGAFRNEWGAQRGSVADMPIYPGDPLTPFVAAKDGATRLKPQESPTVMKIPVLPISYGDAKPLLDALTGPVAPTAWRGALPLTYHIGPGPARVRLKLRFAWDLAPAYDVIARLPGSEFPDQWVIRGNHRDAWVFGAGDPISGHVAMMEEARAIGQLAKEGNRPRRTVIYASWDAEEPGLLGSTEWVEDHAAELSQKAVVYINTDSNGRGFLGMGGSHGLEGFINEVARDVPDPQFGIPVRERARARARLDGDRTAEGTGDLRISPLGSGSDFTPFLQHLGISALNIGFGGESGGGSYHSAYDSYEHYKRFGDFDYAYGVALARVAGRATMRMANADVLPFRFTALGSHVSRYVDELTELVERLRESTARENDLVASGAWRVAVDPRDGLVEPIAKAAVPHVNFAPLFNARDRLIKAAGEVDAASATHDAASARALNETLFRAERLLLDAGGLPKRPWFRHQVYAPGFYTGYGVKTLPAIREAIEQRDWAEADRQIARVSGVLVRFAESLEAAAR